MGGALAAPPPTIRSTPATITSRRSELRARAAENVLRLAIVLRSGSEFSARTALISRSASRAA